MSSLFSGVPIVSQCVRFIFWCAHSVLWCVQSVAVCPLCFVVCPECFLVCPEYRGVPALLSGVSRMSWCVHLVF